MTSIEDAILSIQSNCKPLLKTTTKLVEKSGGYILSETVFSPINMPPFRQSAMDGYALNLHDGLTYHVIDEIKAGDAHLPVLKKGEAVRIFTGAPVPDSANTIVIQEKITLNNTSITLVNSITKNQNIRPLGEQVKKDEFALKKHTKLTPAAIGYLTALGITIVSVFKKPSIALVTTGNELIEPGQTLPMGKIYESNSKMLQSVLYSLKFYDVTIHKIKDDYAKTLAKLDTVIKTHDLIVITGGISVGDYDFVGKALNALQVNEHFYKVKQKPGKPLFFGKKEESCIFALPGNPAAALTCFYMYVYIALQKMMDRETIELPRMKVKSATGFQKKGDRPQFLKAIYHENEVTILEGQNSSMLQTFALSNALVFAPQNNINIGDTVEVILLPV